MNILDKVLIVMFLIFPMTGISQVVVFYDVMVGGRTVGSVKVLHFLPGQEAGKRRIEAEFSIPFYSGSFFSENQFTNGILKNSVTEHRVNGKKKEQTRTLENARHQYQIDFFETNAEIRKTKDIRFCINSTLTNLYYEEPVNICSVYSERYGQMCTVKKSGENSYTVTLPNGKQSVYSYSDGQCKEVHAELAGFKLRIIKRNISLVKNNYDKNKIRL